MTRLKAGRKKALPSHLETPYVYVKGTKLNQTEKQKKSKDSPQRPTTTPARAPSIRDKRQKEAEQAKKAPAWNKTTHTAYIQLQADFPHLHAPEGDVLAKYSKADRSKFFEGTLVGSSNENTMDNTFKIFEIMVKHRFKGQLDVDPELAERACIADYKAMLASKLEAVQAEAKEIRQAWEGEQAAKLIAQQIKAEEEKARIEEEQKIAKMKELRGESNPELPVPILDDEQIAQLKKQAEEAEAVMMAKLAMEIKVEQMKKAEFEAKERALLDRVDEIKDQIDDLQSRGRSPSSSKQREFQRFSHDPGR